MLLSHIIIIISIYRYTCSIVMVTHTYNLYSEDIVIYDDTEIEEKYLSLDDLGTVLQRLAVELPGIL